MDAEKLLLQALEQLEILSSALQAVRAAPSGAPAAGARGGSASGGRPLGSAGNSPASTSSGDRDIEEVARLRAEVDQLHRDASIHARTVEELRSQLAAARADSGRGRDSDKVWLAAVLQKNEKKVHQVGS